MCTVCVEVVRGRITMKDAADIFNETINVRSGKSEADRLHAAEILGAYACNDDQTVDLLVKAGEKAERWL